MVLLKEKQGDYLMNWQVFNTTAMNSDQDFNFTLNTNDYHISTTCSLVPNTIKIDIKRCRICDHAHLDGQEGCIEVIGQMVTFVSCTCKEYLPLDNLEYLEHLSEKKESK